MHPHVISSIHAFGTAGNLVQTASNPFWPSCHPPVSTASPTSMLVTQACIHIFAWKLTRLKRSSSASFVGGKRSRLFLALEKRLYLIKSTLTSSVPSPPYSLQMNSSAPAVSPSLPRASSKLGYFRNSFQQDFLLNPEKEDVVSHPVDSWKHRMLPITLLSKLLAMECTG